ncbi:hypothetical protein LSM04_005052 [Trypanosoma melophagium]|uniref:uncharacterized protein n=2 Tax=Trypanosoma melophagium TaxID=715481 RepID=UPI00351A2402|nr:hypothetical protein LSM04_005052 [Trypanosoma melophagium]
MWSSLSGIAGAILDHTVGNVLRLSHRTMESFLLWQYGLQLEGGRNKRIQQGTQQTPTTTTTTTSTNTNTNHSNGEVSQLSTEDEVDVCHRQAVAGLTLLAQRVPGLMGGYYRPTLQSVYGKPFTLLAAMKERREKIAENIWLYRFPTPGFTSSSIATTTGGTSSRVDRMGNRYDQRDENDIPAVVWLVMPWESDSPVVMRFVLRLAHSLACNALFVTVPMDGDRGPIATVASLNAMIEASRHKIQARRIIIGGSDLAAMFVLLLLDRFCRVLHLGALAAADPEMARRALCQGVILVDPFVGWETPPPIYRTSGNNNNNNNGIWGSFSRTSTTSGSSSSSSNSNNDSNLAGLFSNENANTGHGNRTSTQQQQQLSAKDRFKQLVMNSSGGYIREWFPPPIRSEAPPLVVLVDEGGFWLQEQCEFNTRVDRLSMEGSEERVFFLPYSIGTAAAGTIVSLSTSVELERLWRMVEKFLSEQLSPRKVHSTVHPSPLSLSLSSTSGTAVNRRGRNGRRRNGGRGEERGDNGSGVRVQTRLREGEATFLAAYSPWE